VTTSVTLTADIGPCPSTTDGIDIVASGITVDLNGHTITGTNSTNTTLNEPVGIGLMNVHNVTVTGPGTVQDFDAGVSVNGGSGNKITGITAQNNVAHVLLTGGDPSVPLYQQPCDYGDGITTDNSTSNVISDNTTTGNGPFSGISLVDASSYDKVIHNKSYNNQVSNLESDGVTPGPCGPFSANAVGQGRPHQDIGIRIEGPGATNNVVEDNQAISNQLEGISIHGNVCPNNPAGVPAGLPNIHNLVENNLVQSNGFADTTDGIGVLTQGPPGIVCVAYDNSIIGNTSDYNANDGIDLGGRGSSGNTVSNNVTDFNGNDGIELSGPAAGLAGTINSILTNNEGHGNAVYDGADGNPGCDNNTWKNNRFVTVNQSCVAAHG
jgi:hypothetical protein